MAKSSNKTVSSILKGAVLPNAKAFEARQQKPWRESDLWRDHESRLPTQLYPFTMFLQDDGTWTVCAETSKGQTVDIVGGFTETFAAFRKMLDLYEEYYPKRAVEQVYFIGTGLDGKMIKVGYSLYPEARLKQLQTGHPEPLKILATTPGGRWLEEKYHSRWKIRRAGGEWFYMGDCIRKEIKRLNNVEA